MFDTVLIPTDGSDSAQRAAQLGAALAEAYGATVHALAVVDERPYSTAVVDDEAVVDEGMTAAEREARRAVAAVADLAADATTAVEAGVPAAAIRDYAADADVDLIAMGTHGRTGVERFVIGSVAESVVRHSDVPVLTARAVGEAPTWPPIERLCCPTDGSEASFAALPVALDVADRFDALVDGCYVVDERMKAGYYDVATALEDVVGGLERTGERATERVATEAAERGLRVTTTTLEGLPSEALATHAESSGADLVVMSTHGRTGLGHALLGSVTERVVRKAVPPVLTVPADWRPDCY
jgi:nucleotide-binding universal stress UspA family protein